MKNSLMIKRMVGIASLAAIVVVLQLLSNYITIGNVSITLALIPIVVGAVIYGPVAGAALGAVMGVMAMVAPSTLAFFMPHNPAATVILCLLKSSLAGFIAGLIFKGLRKKNFAVGIIIAAIATPIINTGLFLIGGSLFFADVYGADNFIGAVVVIFGGIIVNFIIEFIVNSALSPAVVHIVRVLSRNYDLGFTLDEEVSEEELVSE